MCSVAPDSLDFGTVVIGNSADLTFTIKNTGGDTLSGDVSEACTHYSVISGGGPYALAADESVTVTVRFEPTASGTQTCTIETGQAICSDVVLTGYGEPAVACSIEPDSLDFNTVYVWDYKDTTFTIKNTGSEPLIGDVSRTWCPDYLHFSVVSGGGSFNLVAGESLIVTVRFAPADTGQFNCTIETGTETCGLVPVAGFGVDTVIVPQQPQLAGWPNQVGQPTSSGCKVGDIDGDLLPDVVVGSNYIYAWHGDGTEIRDGDNNPLTSGVLNTEGDNYTATVALAEIDGNPGVEIIAASWNTKEVYIFDHDGNTLLGWPQSTELYCWASPVVGDIDGDGDVEIIANPRHNKVYAWHHDGMEVRDGDNNPATNGVFCVVNTDFTYSTPALADIDEDGVDEIIICANADSIYCMNSDGSAVPGWPVPVTATGGTISASPAVGDIDGDGHQEIVVQHSYGTVYGLNHDGTAMSGWPKWIYSNKYFVSSPALADLTGDGKLEVVIPNMRGNCYVFRYNGSSLPNWPRPYAPALDTESSPIIADINQDGNLDIILATENGNLNAWDVNGNYIEGFPFTIDSFLRGTPVVSDLDLDGDIELITSCWNQNVYVWDYEADTYDDYAVWNGFHGNNLNTGWIECSGEAPPICVVQPDTLDFGTVVIGGYTELTFTITNTGNSELIGDVSESCDHYEIISGGGPYSLTTGQFVTVTVRFEPTSTGTQNCSIETGQATCSDVFCTGYCEPAAACSVEPDSLDFGTIVIGSYLDTTFTITNTGGSVLSGDVSESCDHYEIISGGGPFSLAADESVAVRVRFEPTAIGAQVCSIETGQAICSDVACTGYGEPAATCSVQPDTLDFGTVVIGGYADSAFTISNVGGDTLSGTVDESCSDYSIISGGGIYELAADESLIVTVRFEPTLGGTLSCSIETGSGLCSDVYCVGFCIDTIPPPPPEGFNVAYNTGTGNRLTWRSSEVEDFDYFKIYRSENPDLFLYTPVDSTWQVADSTSDTTWVDTISEGWRYRYQISTVDLWDNESDRSSPDMITGAPSVIPERYTLYQNIPNPFNPITTIRFDVPPGGGNVTLRIYDVGGRLVRTLVNGYQSAGRKSVIWDGKDNRAESVASGVYFYRMTSPGFEKTRKMVLLR